jgi:hypothetical protein
VKNKIVIPAIKSGATGSRRLTYVISTKDVDRDQDRILDWDLKAYRKNPIVMAFHDYRSLPVAKTASISQLGDSLIAVAEFISPEISQFADQCFRMARDGFMAGCSVGFRPSPGFPPVRNAFDGLDYPKAELLEWSVCPVPSNSAALRRGVKSAGARSGADLSDEQVIRVIAETVVRAEDAALAHVAEREASEIAAFLKHLDNLTTDELRAFATRL